MAGIAVIAPISKPKLIKNGCENDGTNFRQRTSFSPACGQVEIFIRAILDKDDANTAGGKLLGWECEECGSIFSDRAKNLPGWKPPVIKK